MRPTPKFLPAIALSAAALMLNSMNAFATRSAQEYFGDPGSPLPFSPITGDAWAGTSGSGVSFSNVNSSSSLIALGFTAKIGAVDYNAVSLNSSGFLSFGVLPAGPGDSLYSAPYTSSITTIPNLAAAVNAPIVVTNYTDLGITNLTGSQFSRQGGASYMFGSAIPEFSSSTSTVSDLVPAFAAMWYSAARNPNPDIFVDDALFSTQLVLYKTSADGNFDLRLRYGAAEDMTYTGALAGFSLGNDVKTITNPTSTTDYFYKFVSGSLSGESTGGDGGGTFNAPEIDPASTASSLTLLFGSLILLCTLRRRAAAQTTG
ncbi:MAG TPA: hypothetical protein VN645_14075 [Steroidobacteraceae bacterium]|nr:hypothetical protein [Steroidobacteraceae bacterium]